MDIIRPLFMMVSLILSNYLIVLLVLFVHVEIAIPPTLLGYTGSDVILPCELPNPGENKVKQMQ
jgi:hypothetical protein